MSAEALHRAQREYFSRGHTRSAGFREQQCRLLKKAILEYEPKILEAVARDMGRPVHETYASEVLLIVKEIDHALKYMRSEMRPRRVRTGLLHLPGKSRVIPEPYGNVLIIGPWNYPFHLLFIPLIGAIAAGNTAVLKISEIAEHSAQVIREMIERYFDPHYVAAVEGGVEQTHEFLALPFDYIFFTGSAAVGKLVMARAAEHLTPVTLELGGKNPCIVTPDTPLETAARRICWGKFFNAGQTCVAPDYLLVHESVREPLLAALRATIIEFYGEDAQASADFGRIINARHFTRLTALLQGQDVWFGGESDEAERFIAPTILADVSPQDAVMQEEIFGPLLPVLSYSSLDEAIDFVRRRPKPLAIYLFSEDRRTQRQLLDETSSGSVNINETFSQVASTTLAFGGVGHSGMGSYHGRESFRTFSHYKSVMHRSMRVDPRLKYPPYQLPLEKMKRLLRWLF